jgi:hypothetical protein
MSSDFDPTEFVDGDLAAQKSSHPGSLGSTAVPSRAPTREEVDYKVAEAQQKLAELRRVQEELERERAGLEETRRRQAEFQTGRQEMIQHLTRGLGLLEEAEFDSRRNAEQMAKSIADLRDALAKVQAVNEETWTKDNFSVELTRGLTTLENARMEWNAARLKYPVLTSQNGETPAAPVLDGPRAPNLLTTYTYGDLCRIGFALTWPLAAVVAIAFAVMAILLRR